MRGITTRCWICLPSRRESMTGSIPVPRSKLNRINMSLDSELVDHVLPKLRGYFRELYVGGSYATYKALKSDIKPNDVDIFILGPKRLETWALKQILETIFDEVFAEGDNPDYYKIEGQYKRAQCFIGPHKFDLIFVDQTIENLITKQTAADISKM